LLLTGVPVIGMLVIELFKILNNAHILIGMGNLSRGDST
jgi:hypothetical protein